LDEQRAERASSRVMCIIAVRRRTRRGEVFLLETYRIRRAISPYN
jgi:hypothetical protein